jgi:hypothetical protein
MEQDACKKCQGTGLVYLSAAPGPEPIAGFSSACSCNAGNATWDVVLHLINEVEKETRERALTRPIAKYVLRSEAEE